jgi:hypothetical protein
MNSELNDILVECYKDTRLFAKTFFPDRFYAPFSSLHDQIFELIDSDAPRIAIAAPRGMGKTSIASLGLAAKSILYQDRKFVTHVSMSHDAAMLQTENLKRELVSNNDVRKIFGAMKATNAGDGLSETFSKKSWVSSGGTFIMPRGSGQQVRGLLFKNARPDLIIVDDLEDPETMDNDEIRKKRKEWFNADLLKSTSRIDKNWKIVYIDTLKHQDALLQSLLDSKDWESIRLEICDDNYEPCAPEFFSKEEIMREVDYHREQGILDVFYREFRNLPISTEDSTFKQEYFRYYSETDESFRKTVKDIETFLLVDPAKTVKMHSAESAIIAVGLDRKTSKIYIRDIVARKMYPDELYGEIFDMAARYNCHVLGIEVTSLHEFITQPLKNEMAKRGLFMELIELKARGGSSAGKGKQERVAALVPYYRQGYIYHNEALCGPLEAQLLAFPRPLRWDVMDATAYLVEMLDVGDRFFDPPEAEGDEEDMFDELDYEEPLNDWRVA